MALDDAATRCQSCGQPLGVLEQDANGFTVMVLYNQVIRQVFFVAVFPCPHCGAVFRWHASRLPPRHARPIDISVT